MGCCFPCCRPHHPPPGGMYGGPGMGGPGMRMGGPGMGGPGMGPHGGFGGGYGRY